jgi:hypothetical protein
MTISDKNKKKSWSRVHLEKLIFGQLIKRLLAFYETQRFLTVSTRAHHSSLF